MKIMHSPLQKQTGFTLLESMLTLFVLTIGILGVAGLQMRGMDSGRLASQRMIVVVKTQEIIERMRANVGYGTPIFFKADKIPRNNLMFYNGAVATNGNCNDGTTVCNPAALAADDINEWRTSLAAALPTLTGTAIAVTPAASQNSPYTVTVTVTWTEKNSPQLTTVANPNAYNVSSYTTTLQI